MNKGGIGASAIAGIVIVVIVAVLGVYYLVSYGSAPSSGNEQQQAKAPIGNDKSVDISGFAFNPSFLEINVGDRVVWTNSDSVLHTVAANNGEFSSGSLRKGDAYAFVFSKAGAYKYYCGVHPSMEGTIIVR